MCLVEGCTKKVKCKGLCDTHYAASRRAKSEGAQEAHRAQARASYHKNKESIQARRKKAYCPDTRREYNRAYYQQNRDKMIEAAKAHAAKDPEKFKARMSAYYKEYGNKAHLVTKFGMTPEDVRDLLLLQGFECPVCGDAIEGWGRGGGGVVDHCHLSGKVRGILHSHCNSGLGMFKDKPDICERAASYLRKHYQDLAPG